MRFEGAAAAGNKKTGRSRFAESRAAFRRSLPITQLCKAQLFRRLQGKFCTLAQVCKIMWTLPNRLIHRVKP
jgi:hypothetical protein